MTTRSSMFRAIPKFFPLKYWRFWNVTSFAVER